MPSTPDKIPDTRKQIAASRRQNFTMAIVTQSLPLAVIWIVLLSTSPAFRHWAEHNWGYDLLVTVVTLIILDKVLPWRFGGRKRPRW